jgi:hypothetical protein
MKTIDEAKKESTISIMKYKADNALLLTQEQRKGFTIGDLDKSFMAGVEFAQRWIPVDEELPPIGIKVIVKFKNYDEEYIDSFTYCGDIDELCYIVDWRPIEYK